MQIKDDQDEFSWIDRVGGELSNDEILGALVGYVEFLKGRLLTAGAMNDVTLTALTLLVRALRRLNWRPC